MRNGRVDLRARADKADTHAFRMTRCLFLALADQCGTHGARKVHTVQWQRTAAKLRVSQVDTVRNI